MQGLKELDSRLTFLTRPEESFTQARAVRVKVCSKPFQYNGLQVFVHEQEEMERFNEASTLDSLRGDVLDDNVQKMVETIVEWMANTGGLYVVER